MRETSKLRPLLPCRRQSRVKPSALGLPSVYNPGMNERIDPESCIFCKIVRKEAPAHVVWEEVAREAEALGSKPASRRLRCHVWGWRDALPPAWP